MPSASLKSFLLAATPATLRPHWHRLASSPLASRLAQGFFWTLAGTAVARAFTLLSSILVARLLGKLGLGELGMVQNTVGIFSALAGLSMGLTATKYVAQYREEDPARAGAIVRLSILVAFWSGLLMTLAMLLLAPWFATHTLAAPHLAPVLRLGSLLLLLGAVNGAQNGALAGFEAFRSIARINLAVGVFTLPTMLLGRSRSEQAHGAL